MGRTIFAGVALALTAAVGAASASDPSWTEPQAPFRIAGNVYYVGSKGLAAYLITSSQGDILLDGTLAQNAPLIEASVRKLGFSLRDVKILLSSHAHPDHAGGLARLQKDTGAVLLASPGDRWALEHGRSRGDNTAGIGPWPPARVSRLLTDGETVRLGPIAMTALFTPGHTPGCTSWTVPVMDAGKTLTIAFPCSLTLAGNVLKGNHAYPQIVADYRRSFERLDRLNPDIVLPAHPELADVIGRHDSQMRGDRDAWSDSGQLEGLVDAAWADFNKAMGQPPQPRQPPVGAFVAKEDGFSVQFPRTPTVMRGQHDLGALKVMARTYAVDQGGVRYRLTCTDLSGHAFDREAVIQAATDRLSRGGVVRTYAEARLRRAYGRQLSVERPGGDRSIASVFIAGTRLYELEASGRPDPAMIRFQQTLDLQG
jgi:metallo-beta-lactamase class B